MAKAKLPPDQVATGEIITHLAGAAKGIIGLMRPEDLCNGSKYGRAIAGVWDAVEQILQTTPVLLMQTPPPNCTIRAPGKVPVPSSRAQASGAAVYLGGLLEP